MTGTMAPPSKGDRAQVKVRIPKELHVSLIALAATHHRAMTEEIHTALEEWVARHLGDPAPRKPAKRR